MQLNKPNEILFSIYRVVPDNIQGPGDRAEN